MQFMQKRNFLWHVTYLFMFFADSANAFFFRDFQIYYED